MKFKSKKSTTTKTPQSTTSVWGDASGVPDIAGYQLAIESEEIRKTDIATSFDGAGDLNAEDSTDMWGESIDLQLHSGVIDFGEPEVIEAEMPSAESGFHFSDGDSSEFTLAGPSGTQNNRRTVFAATSIIDEEEAVDAQTEEVIEVRTRYVRSFTEYASVDYRGAGLPEPIPARVAVKDSK